MIRSARALRIVQTIVLAMVLVVSGLVNGLQAHVVLDHHAGAMALDALDRAAGHHGHDHDDPESDADPDGGAGGSAHEAAAHHHAVDGLASWPAGMPCPDGDNIRRLAGEASVTDWASWPPHRPPCAQIS
jgi:hypothetical protein